MDVIVGGTQVHHDGEGNGGGKRGWQSICIISLEVGPCCQTSRLTPQTVTSSNQALPPKGSTVSQSVTTRWGLTKQTREPVEDAVFKPHRSTPATPLAATCPLKRGPHSLGRVCDLSKRTQPLADLLFTCFCFVFLVHFTTIRRFLLSPARVSFGISPRISLQILKILQSAINPLDLFS